MQEINPALLAKAKQTFGSVEKAWEWLQKKNRTLGDKTPQEIAQTPEGVRAVWVLLNEIDRGGVF